MYVVRARERVRVVDERRRKNFAACGAVRIYDSLDVFATYVAINYAYALVVA